MVDPEPIVDRGPPADPSRRGLLRTAAASASGLAAAVLVACGSSRSKSHAKTTITAIPGPDVPILNHALDLEHIAIAAYTAAAPLLTGSAHLAAQRFLSQEIAHASELGGLVAQAGGVPHKAKASYNLGHPRSMKQLLNLLYRLEQVQIQAYITAVPLLSKGSVRQAVSAICANDAQHVSVLRLALERNPVPTAFVTGDE